RLSRDYLLYVQGQDLERAVQTEQVTDLDKIWEQWSTIADGHPNSWLLRGPRRAVKARFIAAADRVIESYRDGDVVSESRWNSAREQASRAIAVEPDNISRGKLRIAEGHVLRFSGARRNGSDYIAAAEKFDEAERLLPSTPDAQLGLVSVY